MRFWFFIVIFAAVALAEYDYDEAERAKGAESCGGKKILKIKFL